MRIWRASNIQNASFFHFPSKHRGIIHVFLRMLKNPCTGTDKPCKIVFCHVCCLSAVILKLTTEVDSVVVIHFLYALTLRQMLSVLSTPVIFKGNDGYQSPFVEFFPVALKTKSK